MPFFDADCAEAISRVPPASVAASTATTQRFFMASLQLAASMNHPEFGGPRGDWATDLQPPIPGFGLPVKGCDLLLRAPTYAFQAGTLHELFLPLLLMR